jgi:hypothetical protein
MKKECIAAWIKNLVEQTGVPILHSSHESRDGSSFVLGLRRRHGQIAGTFSVTIEQTEMNAP